MALGTVATLSCSLQVKNFRLSSQFFEKASGATGCSQTRNLAFWIVQPFGIFVRGINRANRLTRGFVTVLTEHRHVFDTDIGKLAFVVTVDADPMNGATLSSGFGIGYRQIVLGMARGYTSLAAGAA